MKILAGDEHIAGTPWKPYDERIVDVLDAWSQEIRERDEARLYPDVMTFAFFIRKGSIGKKKIQGDFLRLGRGLAFHIAPSNVPVNCMYTLVFGMLSGCANIVRVPSREFKQVEILTETLSDVLSAREFSDVCERTQVIRYDRDERVKSGQFYTEFFSSVCDVRVIWGGDDTIADIRKFPTSPRTKEITFPDRYSIGLIDVDALIKADDDEVVKLAKSFYNDTYLMDQNACSTPHLIGWIGGGADGESVSRRFWEQVAQEADRYDLADIKVSDKFADLCETVGKGEMPITEVHKYNDNLLYVLDVDDITYDLPDRLRGRFGMFFQFFTDDIAKFNPILDNPKVQTVAAYGVDSDRIREHIVKNELCGVDRVVPFGKTLDIDTVWDGYDLVAEMSRIIS